MEARLDHSGTAVGGTAVGDSGLPHGGGTRLRPDLAGAWREAAVFTDAARAAPAAAEHHGTEQFAAPVPQPAAVNARIRVGACGRTPAGSRRPGRFGSAAAP
ncbi:hypothetical protein [Streptomyces sp. NRRL F-5123]|uniref:hypothetical protein n=1 Tax=Streptomyces sp. NRRL F-5123 TaxID=1463856 RepID=UPI0006935C59|nr:hypothetical protein [Streptomyces sp. NRRL F-5123]